MRGFIECVERRTLLTNVPANFTDSLVAGGLIQPVAMDFAPDGRIFVTEKAGRVRVIKDGVLLPTPFATPTVNSQGERGALGITLDPDFANNHFVYLYYTATTPTIHNRVSRFTANGDIAADNSETVLLDLDPLASGAFSHNGGGIHFGPDGKLYVSQGENTNAPQAQSLDQRFGKILRINPDGSIPTDNPFFNTAVGDNRSIWAFGLRNPFTFAFRAGDGLMFINDVGGNAFEEINPGVGGANYGWPQQEGPASTDPALTAPVYFYGHTVTTPTGSAITGGTFYDGTVQTFPAAYQNDYFFADLGSRFIYSFDTATNTATEFATDLGPAVDLTVGPDGGLYYVGYTIGEIHEIQYVPPAPTQIVTQPISVAVATGDPATFTIVATGDSLAYQWQRDGVDISGATDATYTLNTVGTDDGARFRVLVTGADGVTLTSDEATATVQGNLPRLVRIVDQPQSMTVLPGELVTFEARVVGSGLAFQWQRDGVDIAGATSSEFTIEQPTLADSGAVFRLVTTGQLNTVVSDDAVLTVTENHAPIASINSPRQGSLFTAGRAIHFSGKATDVEDRKLPLSAFAWQIDLLPGGATPPVTVLTAPGVRSGSYNVPRDEPLAVNSGYRIRLTVTDSGGRANTVERIVIPRTVQIFVAPSVPGLTFNLDGQPHPDLVFDAVAGTVRKLGADAIQVVDGVSNSFKRWSNSREAEFDFIIPAKNRTLKLLYVPTPTS